MKHALKLLAVSTNGWIEEKVTCPYERSINRQAALLFYSCLWILQPVLLQSIHEARSPESFGSG